MKKYWLKAGLSALLLTVLIHSIPAASPTGRTGPVSVDTLRPDPVCNMKVDDKKGDTIHYKGHIFGFCSKGCRASFL